MSPLAPLSIPVILVCQRKMASVACSFALTASTHKIILRIEYHSTGIDADDALGLFAPDCRSERTLGLLAEFVVVPDARLIANLGWHNRDDVAMLALLHVIIHYDNGQKRFEELTTAQKLNGTLSGQSAA
jgi:hypothetical protein